MSKPTMNPVLRDFWKTPSRNKVLYGGRSSSKSWDTATQTVRLSSNYKLKILCTRQYQNNIKESVYTLIKAQIYRFGLQNQYNFTKTSIIHKVTKSEFLFYGIARNIEEIKSTEGVDILWIEEAHNLTKEQWDILNPTIRKENSEIWIIFNPSHITDFVFQKFVVNPPKDTLVRKINYPDNPFLSSTMLKIIEEEKEKDFEHYEHIYLGKPYEGDDRALFEFTEIENAMNNDLDGIDRTGIFSYAVDVARYGKDKSILTKRRGYHIYGLQEFKSYSTMELANAVSSIYMKEEDKKPNALFVDTIGIGAGVMDRLEEKGYNAIDSNVSMKADNNEIYYNKRAETYFLLREFIRKGGKIPNDEELKEELLVIKYFYSKSNGKIQIQSKDEIKEELGRSPDKSDSTALHFFSEVRIEKSDFENIQRQAFKRRRRRR